MGKNNNIVYNLIEEFGEDELNNYIKRNDVLYDEDLTIQIKSTEDLEDLTKEQLDIFREEYEEYLDNTTLDEEELEGWNDLVEKMNKD